MEMKGKTVCVTAASGFLGSSLVKSLLQTGYVVHATCRDPDNPSKTNHLVNLPGAKERLHLFKEDLFEQGSFDSAIQGCDFLINLATSLDYTKDPELKTKKTKQQNHATYQRQLDEIKYQTGFIQPTIDGTLDILRACKEEKIVRRVIHTSSITAASPLNESGELKECIDESCWSPIHYLRREKPPVWAYFVAKTLTERSVLEYGANKENEMEVVTVVVAITGGPSLTPTFPDSISTMLSPITGKLEYLEILTTFQSLFGSIQLVHIEDVCNAHIFLMDHPFAIGRYLCCSNSLKLVDMTNYFCKHHPQAFERFEYMKEDEGKDCIPISSNKLTQLGFSYKYGIDKIIDHSIQYAREMKAFE